MDIYLRYTVWWGLSLLCVAHLNKLYAYVYYQFHLEDDERQHYIIIRLPNSQNVIP